MRIAHYRPDVDGLRAVAVLAVVLFHAMPGALPGGFVGVDVFFVISGYLISRILFEELDRGAYSIRRFYVRRVKRIFPALCVVLAATLAAGWVALLAAEYAQLGRHVAGSAAFVANLVLYGESGYFDAAAELKPLLHLWSLGIEEQFYLVWPLMLAGLWRWRRAVPWTMGALVVASLVVGVVLTDRDAAGAFFLPHARFWELLAGALLSYTERQRQLEGRTLPPGVAHGASVLGLGAIAAALALIDESARFPGFWAALPVLGAALLLAAGPGAWVNRGLLAARPMVWVGLVSYPLYLWHWPLLSLARICESGEPPLAVRLAAVALAAGLSWATYRFVETPIRFPRGAADSQARGPVGVLARRPVALLAVALTLIAAAGFAIDRAGGVPARVTHLEQNNAPFRWTQTKTTPGCLERFPVRKDGHCKLSQPDGAPTVVLVGDSHADALNPGLAAEMRTRGEVLLQIGSDGCPPVFGVERFLNGIAKGCPQSVEATLRKLLTLPEVHTIVLVGRYAAYFDGQGFGIDATRKPGWIHLQAPGPRVPPDASQYPAVFTGGVERLLEVAAASGRRVVFVHQVPELGFDPHACARTRPLRLTGAGGVKSPCAVPRAEVEARQRPYRDALAPSLARHPQVRVVDPMDFLCDADWCYGDRDGRILYRDDDHLGVAGAAYVAARLGL